jgi:branched-chain amino acid transport system substrate-binding protein
LGYAKHLVVAALVAAAMTAGLAGCGSSTSTRAAKTSAAPLRIFEEVPLGVPALHANALMSENAAKAAVDAINAHGGVLGHPIELTVVNDNGDPTTAVTELESALSSSARPAVFIQGDASNTAAAVLPILTQNKILSLNQSPTATSSDPKDFPYNFDLSPSVTNYASAFCPYAKTHGGKSVGIIHGDDAYGQALSAAMVSACQSDGVTVVGDQSFPITALSMTSQLETLESSHPSFLLMQAYGPPAGYVLQDIEQLGWNVPILGDDSVSASAVLTTPPPAGLLGTAAERNLLVEAFPVMQYEPPSKQPAAVHQLITGLERLGGVPAPLFLAYTYDAVVLAAYAAEAAHTTTNVPAMANALVHMPPGAAPTAVFPRYYFNTTSHAPNEPPSAFEFLRITKLVNGQFGGPGS